MDLVRPSDIPNGCEFFKADILDLSANRGSIYCGGVQLGQWQPDFICASSPCEQFSVHGMKHFHPNPPYPELGIKLFEHTRHICEESGVPYVMENVRAAQPFVGNAVHHCGPFYLWGTGVPPILSQGINKGLDMGWDAATGKRTLHRGRRSSYRSKARATDKAETATIPPELAGCVADYAARILEVTA